MKFPFFRKSKSSGKEKKNKKRKSKDRDTKIPTDISDIVNSHRNTDVTNESCMEEVASLPLSDIMDLSYEFKAVLNEYVDFQAKRRFIARIKSVAAQMMLKKYTLSDEDLEGLHAAAVLVRSLQEDAPPVRARRALAIHRFCLVIEEEMESGEFSQGTGLLATLRVGISYPIGANSTLDNGPLDSNDMEKVMQSIPKPAKFDVEAIFQQLIASDKLPSLEEMGELVRRTAALLKQEANIVVASAPCVLVGDIHGQKQDLIKNVFSIGGPTRACNGNVNKRSECSKTNKKGAKHQEGGEKKEEEKEEEEEGEGMRDYVFLGDYVDRGPSSLQCIALLFAAKLRSPRHVFLLRGNHESSETNRNYGFLKECHELYPISKAEKNTTNVIDNSEADDSDWNLADHPLWVAANRAFQCLPLCAIVTNAVKETCKVSGVSKGGHVGNKPSLPEIASGRPNGNNAPRKITICAMHGGLSPFISESLDGILAIDRYRSIEDGAIADLTWADPIDAGNTDDMSSRKTIRTDKECNEDCGVRRRIRLSQTESFPAPTLTVGYTFSCRGRGHNFGEDVTMRFLHNSEIDLIVRAHQCVLEGYQWQHHRRLLTLFSAPNYCGMGNKGAVLILHTNGEMEIVQFDKAVPQEEDVAPQAVAPTHF